MADVIKVLLVDDIPETRENLRKLLAFENDIEVVGAAATGREGLELAKETRPHIVLMDINMPDMDGIEATEQIGRLVPGAAVVMMSVQTEAEYLRRAMMAGARDFLTKPISGDDLYSTVRRVFENMPQQVAPMPGLEEDTRKKKSVVPGAAGNLIVVYSPQGGAGVTTVASNMATAMMSEGTRVLLIDADLQFGDVSVFLNLQAQNSVVDLSDAVQDLDNDLIENVLVGHPSGLKVLLAPSSPEEAERVIPASFNEVVSHLRGYYDYIIVDMAHRLDDITLTLMDEADRIVLVATPTLPSIKNARIMLDLFQTMDYEPDKIMFVMNRVSTEKAGRAFIPIEAIEKRLRRKAVARIPLDEKTFLSAVNQGVSVIAKEPNRSPAKDLITFASDVKRSFSVVDGDEDLDDDTQDESGSRFKLW